MSDLTELMNHTYNLCENGEYENAIEYFNAILEKEPYNLMILIDKGVTLENMGEYKKAISCYEKGFCEVMETQ